MKYITTPDKIQQITKLIKSPPRPALRAIGVRVKSSILPNEWRRRLTKSERANVTPCTSAYTT